MALLLALLSCLPQSVLAQTVRSVSQPTLTLQATGDEGEIVVQGRALNLLASVRVVPVERGGSSDGIVGRLGAGGRGASRTVTIVAESGAAAGDYRVELVSRFRRSVTIDFVLTVESAQGEAGVRDAPPAIRSVDGPDFVEVGQRFRIQVSAQDDQGLALIRVRWARGREEVKLAGQRQAAPFVTLTLPEGRHSLNVVAIDQRGNESEPFLHRVSVTAPPPVFEPVTVTTDALVMAGVRFEPVTVTTDALVMAGVRFEPVTVTTDVLVMAGVRFEPVFVSTDALVMAGNRELEEAVPVLTVLDVPTDMTAGEGSTLTVTLDRAAPAGGIEVQIGLSSQNLSADGTVFFVPEGEISAALTLSVSDAAATGVESVTATLGDISLSHDVSVTGGPDETPPSIDNIDLPAEAAEATDVEIVVTASDNVGLDRIDILYGSLNRPGRPSLSRRVLNGETDVTEVLLLENLEAGAQVIRVMIRDGERNTVIQEAEITVVAPAPVLETLEVPADLGPGEPSTITVTLDRAAPVGGVEVEIALSSNSLATDAAVFFIPEGQTSAEVGISVSDDAAAGVESVTATLADVQISHDVTVTATVSAPVLDLLEVPAELLAGETAAMGITLDRAAPAGGVEVEIVLSSASLTADGAMLFVPEGESHAEIDVTAATDAITEIVSVTALLGESRLREDVSVTAVVPDAGDFVPVTIQVGEFVATIAPAELTVFEPVTIDVGSFAVTVAPPTAETFEPVTISVGSFEVRIVR